MTPDMQILLSGAATLGVPMLLALRELILLHRAADDPDGGTDRRPPPDPSPVSPKLPACLLVEQPKTKRVLTPELA